MFTRSPHTMKVCAATVSFLAILWGMIAGWAVTDRSKTLANNNLALSQLSAAVAAHSRGLLKIIEMSLTTANQIIAEKETEVGEGEILNSAPWLALEQDVRKMTDGLVEILIVDAGSDLRRMMGDDTPRVAAVSDRDYVRAQMAEEPKPGLFVGAPVIGRLSGARVIPMTVVPGRSPNGLFAIAALNLRRLEVLHEAQRPQLRGAIGLVRHDGVVLSRTPYDEMLMNVNISGSNNFDQWVSNYSFAHYAPANRLRNIGERLILTRNISEYSVITIVSQEFWGVLHNWNTNFISLCIFGIFISSVASTFAFFAIRSLGRSHRNFHRFVDVVGLVSDVVWETDESNRFTFISNPDRIRAQETEVLGHNLGEIGWTSIDRDTELAFRQAIKNHQAFTELRRMRIDAQGNTQFASLSGRPYVDIDGKFLGFRGVIKDITELVRRETEDRARAERQAQTSKMETLGRLAGGVAHDFNNLLGAILGYANFLKQDMVPTSDQWLFAQRIITAGERGRDLVEQILTFAKRKPRKFETFPLNELVSEIFDLLVPTLPSSTILRLSAGLSGTTITADRHQIGQVLFNLCLNASDALEGNSGSVVVSVGPLDKTRDELTRLPVGLVAPTPCMVQTWTDEKGDWIATGGFTSTENVVIMVEDTGAGIPALHQSSVFDLLFTTKQDGSGTGLGLAVAQKIVTDHGGAILVNTRERSGTRFEVILPSEPP